MIDRRKTYERRQRSIVAPALLIAALSQPAWSEPGADEAASKEVISAEVLSVERTSTDVSTSSATGTSTATDGSTPASPFESAPVDDAAADATPPAPFFTTSLTGYLDDRLTGTHLPGGRLFPTHDIPALANITEANLQLRLRWGDRGMAFLDASFFHQSGAGFQASDGDGNLSPLADHDVAALRPLTVISEAYASAYLGENARLTLGKKRIVWGPGFAQNPTDLLNPPKDPTDPTFQRTGSWLGWLEFPFERWTLSLVGAAKTLRQYGGIPSSLLYYPDHPTIEAQRTPALDDRDDQPHYALAARLYLLWNDTDINLFYGRTHLYNDRFTDKDRWGLSLSRVWGEWELHVEALAQTGSARLYANPACVGSVLDLGACVQSGTAPAAYDRLTSTDFNPRVLVGARQTLENNGLLSLEYYYVGDGYDDGQFRDYVSLLRQAIKAGAAATGMGQAFGAPAADPASPQKFSFDPLRRHYAFVTWQQPQVADDFTLSTTLILNLHDLSGQLVPGVAWSAQQWLTLSAALFVGLPGVGELGADVGGRRYTEYGMLPSDLRGFVSARAFF